MKRYFYTSFVCLFVVTGHLYGQFSSGGNDFYVTFGRNEIQTTSSGVQLILRIQTIEQADVTLTFLANPALNTTFTVPAITCYDYVLSPAQANAAYIGAAMGNNASSNNTIRVTSTELITLIAINTANQSMEASLVWPIHLFGMDGTPQTDYYYFSLVPPTPANTHFNGALIIAKEDNTNIQRHGGSGMTLQAGQAFFLNWGNTVGVPLFWSNHPFSLFQNSTLVTLGSPARTNFTYEQFLPESRWGTQFILPTNEHGAAFARIIAGTTTATVTVHYSDLSQQSFTITSNNGANTMNYADVMINNVSNNLSNSCYITSNVPIAIMSYHLPKNANSANEWSNPGEAWLPPVNHRARNILVRPLDITGVNTNMPMDHYFSVIVPTNRKQLTTISVNGGALQPIDSRPEFSWIQDNVGNGGYSFGRFYFGRSDISNRLNTTALVDNREGMLAMAWGQSAQTNYHYIAGASGRNIGLNMLINGESADDFNGRELCATKSFIFDVATNLIGAPGIFIKWYIDGIEQTAVQNQTSWTTTLPYGLHTVQLRYTEIISGLTLTHVLKASFTNKQCLFPVDDTVITLANRSVTLDPRQNDISLDCLLNALKVQIAANGKHGFAVVNPDSTVTYTPNPFFVGSDSLLYSITCGVETDYASINIEVIPLPDNFIDPNCYSNVPKIVWDIARKRISTRPVHFSATPLVGDLDGDGHVEVVAPGPHVNGTYDSNTILIFDDSLRWIRTINTPNTPQYNTTNLLIGDVDSCGSGEIIVGSTDSLLFCYSYLGNEKWRTSSHYNPNGAHVCPSLITADIMGDGHAEILAVNRIYDGETGALLVTLPPGGRGYSYGGPPCYMPVFADIDQCGKMEVVAGNTVYKVLITNHSGTAGNNSTVLAQMPFPFFDGFTSVADMNLDGALDVIVTGLNSAGVASMYVWEVATGTPIGNTITLSGSRISRASVGDLNGNGRPAIAFTYTHRIEAYDYDLFTHLFHQMWQKTTADGSGATTMSMFDFNQDGEIELIYRDETDLRIINKDGTHLATSPCFSETHTECPVIVDLDKNRHADILVSGELENTSDAYIMLFGSRTPDQWAAARTVWNQHAYNVTHINENLSIPKYPLHPATTFPGPDGILGNFDDVRPFNAFLLQQTLLSKNGTPVWLTPDLYTDQTLINSTVSGDTLTLKIGMVNQGEAPVSPPVYVALYNETSPMTFIIRDSINKQLMVGDTAYVTVQIPDLTSYFPMIYIVIRVNDNGGLIFPQHVECDSTNNVSALLNPLRHLMMKKDATLLLSPPVPHNGTLSNPVALLYGDTIEYRILAVNAYLTDKDVIIRDTLPPWLTYVYPSAHPPAYDIPIGISPTRVELYWMLFDIPAMSDTIVTFKATTQVGVNASQPMYNNRAWITINEDTMPTNFTYHQGAGVTLVTFSAGHGGSIYNALEQALDYRTSPRSGIVIVPDEGFRFAGWRHDEYISLRNDTINAQSGILYYESLTIYGDVELKAIFEPDVQPVEIKIQRDEIQEDTDEMWVYKNEMVIKSSTPGSVIRIYSVDGNLQKQQILLTTGETKIILPPGIYIVSLNNSVGKKIAVSN